MYKRGDFMDERRGKVNKRWRMGSGEN